MATKKETSTTAKKTAAQKTETEKLIAENEKLKDLVKNGSRCILCDTIKKKDKFYLSTDPLNLAGHTPACKECARKIALRVGINGKENEPTKESCQLALKYLNKPYLESIWDAAVQESENVTSGKIRSNIWLSYMHLISMQQYNCKTYSDSDHLILGLSSSSTPIQTVTPNTDIIDQYKVNKRDVIKAIGYDPFENYPIEADKPILYAQLNSFIDDETKNGGMKMGAVIQIVKKLNQAEKLNDQIDLYISDTRNAASNMPLIDKMAGSSQKLMNVATSLAKDNGLSVNFNNNKSKGANTLSGKMKKLTEIGLREAKINSFDVGTCQGMLQVAEISETARHKQIGYDDAIAQEIKDIKVELVEKLSKERDKAVEEARLLLMENKDLKDYLLSKGLVNSNYEVLDD